MIAINELRNMLNVIGFSEKDDKFTNTYTSGASIEVDFRKRRLHIYL